MDVKEAWFISAKQGRADDVKELIGKIDINLGDSLGNTALHYAAHAGHLQVVTLLVSSKANVNAKNKQGETPIHKAAWKGSAEVCQFLVQNGADLTAKNNEGQTPAQVAKTAAVKTILEPANQKLWEDSDEENEKNDGEESD